jgi:predicted patatin/cPLA2 family phospholipase
LARGEKVGLVLAGGGARGAYEAAVLSVLLPALEARGESPAVIVSTSLSALLDRYFSPHPSVSWASLSESASSSAASARSWRASSNHGW